MKYTFSDEEDEISDALGVRRSRRGSGRGTPAAPAAPTVTASGRQVKSRATGAYGESLLSGQQADAPSPASGYAHSNASEEPHATRGRATRANAKEMNGSRPTRKHIDTYNSVDEMSDDEATSWDGGDEEEEEPEHMELDDNVEESEDETSEGEEPKSLVVHLRYAKGLKPAPGNSTPAQNGTTQDGEAAAGKSLDHTQLPATAAPAQAEPESAPPTSMSSPVQFATKESAVAKKHAQRAVLSENTAAVPSHLKPDSTHQAPAQAYAAPTNPETNGHFQTSHSPFQASLAPPTPASS